MRLMFLMLPLVACGEAPEGLDVSGEIASSPPGGELVEITREPGQRPPPIAAQLQASDLVQGRTALFTIRGGVPNANTYFVRGPHNPGAFCPGALGGSCIDIRPATVMGRALADSWGNATLAVPVPAQAPLVSTSFQAAAPNGTDPAITDVEQRSIFAPGHPYYLGNHDPLTDSSSHTPGFLLGTAIYVPDTVTLLAFGVDMRATGPSGRLALYRDNGINPTALVGQTAAFTPTSLGANTSPALAPTTLTPGMYWLMGEWDAPASMGLTAATDARVSYIAHPWGTPLPDPFPTPQTYTGQDFGMYIVVR